MSRSLACHIKAFSSHCSLLQEHDLCSRRELGLGSRLCCSAFTGACFPDLSGADGIRTSQGLCEAWDLVLLKRLTVTLSLHVRSLLQMGVHCQSGHTFFSLCALCSSLPGMRFCALLFLVNFHVYIQIKKNHPSHLCHPSHLFSSSSSSNSSYYAF